MKTVFTNSELCHVYIAQTQNSGRSGSMFFEGKDIYSYGRHYLAARIYRVKGEDVLLVNAHKYSITTAKHLSEIMSAASHLKMLQTGHVSSPKKALAAEAARLGEEYFDYFLRRTKDWSGFSERTYGRWPQFSSEVDQFNELCDLFDCKSLKIELTELHKELWREHYNSLIERDKQKNTPEAITIRDAARLKAQERKEKLQKAKLSEALAIWKAGGARREDLRDLTPQCIRIKNDTVETTGGASVPLDEAMSLLKKIQREKAKQGEKVGHYSFNRVENDVVVIGCHRIALSEAIEVLAPNQLKLIQGGSK